MVSGHHRPSPGAEASAGFPWEIRGWPTTPCARLLPIAGWPEERARAVEITGGADPVLPTPFRIGAAGAAALAATGLAAADLWELRTGRRQEVAVDLRQAVASLRSGHYMQIDGAAISTERNPVMGVYPAKNGRWSYIHANFPNHRAAAMQRARRARRARGGAPGGRQMGRARTRRGDHRRQGRGRHGAQHGRMGAASAGRRDRLLAADGDRQDRRQRRPSRCPRASGRCRGSACST